MSKLLRTELKEIVKECLVEILSEGLNGPKVNNYTNTTQSRYNSNSQQKERLSEKSSHLDNIVYNKKVNIKKSILASNITADPILNEMLADTAISTLQEQASAERGKNSSVTVSGDNAAKLTAQSDPIDLFPEQAGKWAQLAFSK
jgi:hypothetical protein